MKRTKSAPTPTDSITVTLEQLIACGMTDAPDIVPPLTTLSQTRMDGKTSFKVARLIRDVSRELETYNAERLKLCEKHGKLSDDKSRYTFPTPEAVAAFNDAIKQMASETIVLHHQKMPELLGVVQLTPGEMLTLEWLFG
jgi:hypothetical protein